MKSSIGKLWHAGTLEGDKLLAVVRQADQGLIRHVATIRNANVAKTRAALCKFHQPVILIAGIKNKEKKTKDLPECSYILENLPAPARDKIWQGWIMLHPQHEDSPERNLQFYCMDKHFLYCHQHINIIHIKTIWQLCILLYLAFLHTAPTLKIFSL